MSKIGILLHKNDQKRVLDFLQEQGVMQVLNLTEQVVEKDYGEAVYDYAFKLAELEFALNFLKPYAPVRKGLESIALGEKVQVGSPGEIDFTLQNFDYQAVIEECKELEIKQNKLKNALNEQRAQMEELEPWADLMFNLKNPRETETTRLFIGSLPVAVFDEFVEEVTALKLRFESRIVAEDKQEIRFWFLVEKAALEQFNPLLSRCGFVEFLPDFQENTPHESLLALRQFAKNARRELEQIEKECRRLGQKTGELKIVYDCFSWQKSQEMLKERLVRTQETVFLSGFVPTASLENLQAGLNMIAQSIVLEELPLEEGETPPVKLRNKSFLKPFEGIMKLFGLPNTQESDPTFFLTPFFLVFFGFCLTDVGYGLMLAVGFWALLKFVKFSGETKKMLTLLMYAGWATVVMGVLFGGYMGLTVEQAPAWMVNPETGRFKLQVFDPVNNVYAVMALAYGMGLLQLWLGTLLKGLQEAKTSKWIALQASFSYNILVVLLIFLVLAKMGLFLADFTDILVYAVYANIAFAVWGSAHGTKNVIARPLVGAIVFIQEGINLFSGVMSYSRLFALGLATGIIALVFNTIALTAFDLLPIYVGVPVMIFVILVGHLLNIGLNALGAFIHSSRLQLVEFFGKFFEGGGEVFTPFKKEMKYINLSED